MAQIADPAARLSIPPDFIQLLPLAVYACDADGRILWFNRRAVELWGRTPRTGDDAERFCGSYKLHVGGRFTPHDQCPMASVLRTGVPVRGAEGAIERPDGSIVRATIHIEPIKDRDGVLVGAINCFHETTALHRAQDALERRMEEQAALHDFTARLQRADTPEEVYTAALDAIIRALDCQRASILLFDHAGVMRFVASRWLSEEYRRAVDGHSPWTRESNNPGPIAIDDIEHSDLPEELKQTIHREGIAALAFIPVTEGGRLLGKFMTYYDRPHAFSAAEIDVAVTIARQLGYSVGRVRAARAAQHYAAIVESSEDSIISKDLNGIIQTWNQGAERLFGYRAEEVIGHPVTILIPPERLDEEPEILSRIRSGEKVDHYETVRRRKDGSLIDISLTVSPVRDAHGRIVGASKISRDITERKQAEARLRDSEQRLQDLLAALPGAVYTTDAQGRITYFNQAAVELAGRTPVMGSDQWCVTWKLFWPDGKPMRHDECPMAVALKEGRPVRGVEAVAERPDGTRVPFIPYPTPLRDAAGNVVGAINMLVDISERRQAETHQRVLLDELNHRVKNNMQMMQSLLDGASKRVSHPEAQAVLNEASRRIAAMAAAQRVLYATANATQFSCEEFLAAVCQTAQETLPGNVTVVWGRATGELPNDSAMPLALILNELLTNAAKYGARDKPGAVIRAGLAEDAEGFELYVEDDGPGFDFEAVRRRSSGLQLVQGLARQLRGKFHVGRDPTRCSVRISKGGHFA
jgi:PAS domain S-box-containing protein